MASPLGDQPGSQHPLANSCLAPASPSDPGPSPSRGPDPRGRHEPSRGRGGSGCGRSPPWDQASSPGGKKGFTSRRRAEPAAGLGASPGSFSLVEFEDCLGLPQINSLGCFFIFFLLPFFSFAKKFGGCLKRFTFFWEHRKTGSGGLFPGWLRRLTKTKVNPFPFLFGVAEGERHPSLGWQFPPVPSHGVSGFPAASSPLQHPPPHCRQGLGADAFACVSFCTVT